MYTNGNTGREDRLKEFTTSLGIGVSKGLRPDDRIPRNSGYLTQCQNARVSRLGDTQTLTTFTVLIDPIPDSVKTLEGMGSTSHPFPQIFKGREETLIFGSDKVWHVDDQTGSWDMTVQDEVDGYDHNAGKSIVSGGPWHFADMGQAWAAFNGSCILYRTNRERMFGGYDPYLVVTSPLPATGCAFRGRMVMAGFSSFYNDNWEAFLRGAFDLGLGIPFPTEPGTNFVWWSQIGSHGFWLIYPNASITGLIDGGEEPYTEDYPMLWDIISRNEMGFMPMNWQGTVQCVKPLGKGMMVYGDNGISYMPMAGNTFGLVDLLPYGVASRGAVGGSHMEHVFVDKVGWLWMVRDGSPPKRLGYREFFEDMLNDDIVISYDPIEDEYHITDGTECYVLGRGGLFESTYMPTSLVVSEYTAGVDTLVGLYTQPGDADDEYAIIATDVIDMGLRTIKTIERVVVSATNTASMYVAIDWRMKSSDSWSRTGFSICNYEGVAYFPVTGVEFRVVVRITDYTKLDLDDIDIQFKTTDKRIIRGTYALKNVARTN